MKWSSTAGDRARGRRLVAMGAAALFASWTLGGCGHKEAPRPKPQIVPQQTTDLKVQQRGSEVILSLTYPTTTISGTPLGGVQAVEFYEMVREMPAVDLEERRAQAQADVDAGQMGVFVPQRLEDLLQVDPLEFSSEARARLTLTGAELDGAVSGSRVIARLPFGTPPPRPAAAAAAASEASEASEEEPAAEDEPVEETDIAYIYAVRTTSLKGLSSAFSNLVKLVRRDTPPPPDDFAVEAQPDGIHLSWTAPAGDVKLFGLYRRDARARFYDEPLRTLPPEIVEFVDRTARFGESYIYAVTAVVNDYPKVETALSAEHEVDYADRFAPPAPRNVVAFAERGSVRLLWDATTANDVDGYFVERRLEGGEWEALNSEALKELELTDRNVLSGRTYDYRVSAIDQLGNRGEPGQTAQARVP